MYFNKEHYHLNIPKKIIFFGDIHYSNYFDLRIFIKLIELIKEEHPDYILIGGDLLDDSIYQDNMKPFINFIKSISKLYKTIIVLGNHDYIIGKNYQIPNKLIKTLKSINNVYLLENEALVLEDITIYGYLPDYTISKNINGVDYLHSYIPKNKYNILLTHSSMRMIRELPFDLVLSGHTHGGLLPTKIYGNFGLISPDKKILPKNVRGLIKEGKTKFIVTSGITKLSENSKIFKHLNFLFPISITIID